MPSLTSQLIISLVDKVSGPAKGAAGSLKGVASAANQISGNAKGAETLASNLDKVAKAANRLKGSAKAIAWGDTFQGEIDKLRLTSREIDKLTRDYQRFQQTLRGTRAASAIGALDDWRRNAIANIHAVRKATDDAERSRERMMRGWRGGARFAAGTLGVGGAGYAAQRGIRGTIRAGGELEREGGRAYLAGMTPSEAVKAQAMARDASRKYPSIDAAQIMERLRSLRSFTGDFDKGAKLLDDQLQGLTVLQSVKGKDQAMDQMQQFMRGMDVLGKNEDPAVVGRLTNAYVKALGVDPDLNMGQFSQFARKSKSAGAALSDDFLGSIVPTFMQDLGGPEMGTALGTLVSQAVSGRGTEQSKAFMKKAGLRDKKGKIVDPDLLLSNPYDWVNKYAPDAMKRMKLDPAKDADVTKFMSDAFSAQTASNIMGKFMTQRDQAERNKGLYAKAPDMKDSAGKLREVDPFVAAEGFMAQLRNLGSALAEGPLKSAVPMLNSFTDAIARLTDTLSKNPDLASKAGWAATAAGGTAAGVGGWLLARKGISWLTGRGAATTMTGLAEGGTATAGGAGGLGSGLAAGALAGAAMSAFSTEVLKANKEAADALVANSMLGAMSGDAAVAAGILNAPELAEQIRRDREKAAAERQAQKDARKINFGEMAPATGGSGASAMGLGMDDVWKKGAEGVKHLDVSAEASAAGAKSGGAFKSSISAELSGVDQIIQAAVQRWIGMLNFSAHPTISPNISTPSAPAAPGKGASLQGMKAKQQAAFADYGIEAPV